MSCFNLKYNRRTTKDIIRVGAAMVHGCNGFIRVQKRGTGQRIDRETTSIITDAV